MITEKQQTEIESIKERTITLNLSDAVCERLVMKAGIAGRSVAQLLESFIGDLVDGRNTNGCDEREYANNWFNQCWFAHRINETLLRRLLENDCDIGKFLVAYDELQEFKMIAESSKELVPADKLRLEKEYEEIIDDFLKEHSDADEDREIRLCRRWLQELQQLRNTYGRL